MQKHSLDFSQEEVKRLAQDPAVQQLLHALSGADPKQLRSAINQAQSGDLESAKNTLANLLQQRR